MAWLWTDTLAALLMEHDRVRPDQVEVMSARPVGYRLCEDQDPLDLAREVLRKLGGAAGSRGVSP
jgi:hypothetical protein